MLLECLATETGDGDVFHTAIYGIEARSESNDVCRIKSAIRKTNALRFESRDWIGFGGDCMDIGLVELVIVVLLE